MMMVKISMKVAIFHVDYIGLSRLCLKFFLKCFWEFPKKFRHYICLDSLLLCSIMLTVITAVSYVYTHN